MTVDTLDSGLTLTVLGCGTLGTAILSGLLSATRLPPQSSPGIPEINGHGNKGHDATSTSPLRIPTDFIACVRGGSASCAKVKRALGFAHGDIPSNVTILADNNLQGVQQADIILLACQPHLMGELLAGPGIGDALNGKLLISILAGVSTADIQMALDGGNTVATHQDGSAHTGDPVPCDNTFYIVRAMPNIASFVLESMTVITTCSPPLPAQLSEVTDWIFNSIGEVAHIPPSVIDVSTALCGSGTAFFALMLEAIVDGAVSMGLQRKDALRMASHTLRGTAALVLAGQHPAVIRDSVATPGGSTMRGLLALEEGKLRATISNSLRVSATAASTLGKENK